MAKLQETSLSLERLSDIVDHPEEIEIAGDQLPAPYQRGDFLQAINFRFATQGPLALANVYLDIPLDLLLVLLELAVAVKHIVEASDTVYDPIDGAIRIDGFDISKVDLYSLRSQIGVVPQDSLLFDGTVTANIALTKPDASFEEIMAAQVACAHEFIQCMPAGYSSLVGERGAGLSGGQRQHGARMVLKRPRLLVLDEATGALDIQTEMQVTQNLMHLYQGRTVTLRTVLALCGKQIRFLSWIKVLLLRADLMMS